MLTVTTPATNRTLLTVAEMRQACGLTSGSDDALLEALGMRAADVIAAACNVSRGGIAVPTLRLETLTETLRLVESLDAILLARRFVTQIDSVTVDGTALTSADYELEPVSGTLHRLKADKPVCWASGKVVVVYRAGFQTVPDDLKLAAGKLVASFRSETGRDPNLKRDHVEGVGETEYWVGSKDDPAIPLDVMNILAPYCTPVV
jgi:hypothetical protein